MNIVPLQLVISPGGLVPVSSENNLEFLNCRAAPERLVKRAIKKTKKSEQENQRTELYEGAHTTLLCCCCACALKSQRTGILAVIHIDICSGKAVSCARYGYPVRITSIYSNGLGDISMLSCFATSRR